ncbi:MAG TPA: DHHA1 domain-containing protein [bacterium]|nr:DHHA1 domain-containing protein [bacterium]HPN33266.1 DHHA1 domain-containing protein [bacterium]
MTERLYFRDAYQTHFSARVMQSGVIDGRPAVVLDQTCFYPTSGGQMHDTGWLNGIAVHNVQYQDGEIWHLLSSPLQDGAVEGCIDWQRRFDFMQQHTAFHILAGCFSALFKISTLASHLGEEVSTIEIDVPDLTQEIIRQVEEKANQVVWENRAVDSFFVTPEQANDRAVRKKIALDESVRLVEIAGLDVDPCGGTHVRSTAQVGLIKMLAAERIRGHWRVNFVAGRRSWQEFCREHQIIRTLSDTLTTGADQLTFQVEKILAENKEMRKVLQQHSRAQADQAMAELCERAAQTDVVVQLFPELSMEDLRRIAVAACKKQPGIYLLAAAREQGYLVFANSRDQLDLRPVFKAVLPMIDGRGGGEATLVQGGGPGREALELALERAAQLVRQARELSAEC